MEAPTLGTPGFEKEEIKDECSLNNVIRRKLRRAKVEVIHGRGKQKFGWLDEEKDLKLDGCWTLAGHATGV